MARGAWLTRAQVAKELGISISGVRLRERRGQLVPQQQGGMHFFHIEDVRLHALAEGLQLAERASTLERLRASQTQAPPRAEAPRPAPAVPPLPEAAPRVTPKPGLSVRQATPAEMEEEVLLQAELTSTLSDIADLAEEIAASGTRLSPGEISALESLADDLSS